MFTVTYRTGPFRHRTHWLTVQASDAESARRLAVALIPAGVRFIVVSVAPLK